MYPLALFAIFLAVLALIWLSRGGNKAPSKGLTPPTRKKAKKIASLPPFVQANKLYYQQLLLKRKELPRYCLASSAIKTTRNLNETQKEFLYQELKKVPLPSGAAMRLSEMLRDPFVDSKEVAALASSDPVVSARLLAVVNSAYFRPASGKKVNSIHRAILLLGFNQVRNLLFQLVLEHAVNRYSPLSKEEIRKIWLHSAAVSVAAGELAKRQEEHPGLVLTAGLMHDIGKFFLPFFKLEDEGSFLAHEMEEDTPPLLREENQTGFNHALIGGVLCYVWRLPKEIMQAVSYHHFGHFDRLKSLSLRMRRVITTVAVADYICHLLRYADEDPYLYEIPKEALAECGFPDQVEFLITPELEKEIEKMVALLKEYSFQ